VASQQQASNTPAEAKDEWRTPPFVFAWAARRFAFSVDLAANDENALCDRYLTRDRNALSRPWAPLFGEGAGWCNPPYSAIDAWLEKAIIEARQGFTTVFLIPTPNGEQRYADHVLGVASELVFITGRLAFRTPAGEPITGNTRGSCLVAYRAHDLGNTRYLHVLRDDMAREAGVGAGAES